jgi:hypothetical protein
MQIYDLNFNLLATVTVQENKIDYLIEGPNDIVFIQATKILFFDMNTFSVVGYIQNPSRILPSINENITFINLYGLRFEDSVLYNYKIKISSILTDSNFENFICKMNPFKHHLFSNPYYLPCGNSACLDCIYKSFNLYRRSIKCKFLTCKKEHYLSHQLEEDWTENKIIEENIYEIMNNILIKGNDMIDSQGNY